MANPITGGLKKAPKWAWYVVAGIGFGGGAIMLFRAREARTAALNATVTQGDPSQSTVGVNPSPIPGIVVPPVIIPQQQNDNGNALILSALDFVTTGVDQIVAGWQGVAGGWQDVAGGWQQVYTPVIDQNSKLTDLLGASYQQTQNLLMQVALAGPPPSAAQTPVFAGNPSPAELPAPAPAPACPPGFPGGSPPDCYADCGHDECHCEGTGANRKCWTQRDHGHCHQDGRRVHMSYEFIRNGC